MAAALAAIWSPELPERLGAGYWNHLTRLFAGVLRARHDSSGVVILVGFEPLVLMRFGAPRHELRAERATVRWPIAGGLLVARAGGSLEIAAEPRDGAVAGEAVLHVRVVVDGYRPTVARRLGEWLYLATQARVHVWVTHGYLRALEASAPRQPE